MYGVVTDGSASGQAGVYYASASNGTYELLITTNGVGTYTVTQGTSAPGSYAFGGCGNRLARWRISDYRTLC